MSQNDIKNAGLKVTLPRTKILKVLETTKDRHLTAEEIYKHLLDLDEDIGLATVYRVLTQFEAAGLVMRHHFEGGRSVFELATDQHHDHLMCVRCGKIVEFVDETIESRQKLIAKKHGFNITDHVMYLYGFCSPCAKAEGSKS